MSLTYEPLDLTLETECGTCKTDYGRGFQAKVLSAFQVFSSSLKSGKECASPLVVAARGTQTGARHRGTSLIRNLHPVGPYCRTMPPMAVLGWGAVSYERGAPVFEALAADPVIFQPSTPNPESSTLNPAP